jgi:serine/threonine-protein kinase
MTTVESEPDRKGSDPPFRRSSSGSGSRVRQRIGRYEVVGEIASGGMATVYLALLAGARGPQRFVALKVLHPHLAREPEFVAMFLDEARLASSIRDPHVVPIAEIGRTEDGFFLVMDYVEGDTLARFAARAATRGTRLPRDVVVRVLLDTLAGLHAAHELTDEAGRSLGLVHRDVSPQNILLGTDGFARITDFGVARAAARLSSTRNGRLKGKLAYMAPEQARSESTDRRADVFAAGILLWEMLAGRRLFKAETEAATILRVVVDPIPRLCSVAPDVPACFDAVCAKALSRNPDDRYQTARQMADALAAAAAEAASSSPLDLGLASPRDVAAYVQQVIGQEIAMQRDVVRAWLEQSDPGDPEAAKARWSSNARLPLHRPLGEIVPKESDEPVTATTTVGDEARPAVEAALREIDQASDGAGATRLGPGTPRSEPAPADGAPAKPRLLLQPEGPPRTPHPRPVRSLAMPAAAMASTPTRRGIAPLRPMPAPATPSPEAAFEPPPAVDAATAEVAEPTAASIPEDPRATPGPAVAPPLPEPRPAAPEPARAPRHKAVPSRPAPADGGTTRTVVIVATFAMLGLSAALAFVRSQSVDEPVGTPLPTAPAPVSTLGATTASAANAAASAEPSTNVQPSPPPPPSSATTTAPVVSSAPVASTRPSEPRAPRPGGRKPSSKEAPASTPSAAPGPGAPPDNGGDDLSNPYRH